MKKILFLCSRIPYPLIGGDKIRMFNSLKMLSQEYSIDLLYIDREDPKKNTEFLLKSFCNKVQCFKISILSHYIKTLIGFFFNNKPLQVNYYYDKRIQNWIDNNIDNYDMVYCNHIRTTEYVRKYNISKIVDFVDSIAMNYMKAYKNSSGIWKLIYKIEKERVASYEKEIAKEFDKKIVISHIDKDFIDPENKYSIKVIGDFVDDINYDKNLIINKNQLSFLGKMNYEPNVSAVVHFSKKIFPILKRKFPNLIFKIIGSYPTKKVKKLGNIEGIEITGFVENPYNEIQKSLLFIAPMISGAGVQNKILEAMKMGKCVITTEIGAEGLESLNGDELIISKNDNELLQNIISCIEKKNLIKNIEINSKKYISKYYSKEVIYSIFIDFIKN